MRNSMTLRTSPAYDIPKMMRFYGLDRFPYIDEYDYHRIMRIYQMLREETAQSFGPPPHPFKFPPTTSSDVNQTNIKKEVDNSLIKISYKDYDPPLPEYLSSPAISANAVYENFIRKSASEDGSITVSIKNRNEQNEEFFRKIKYWGKDIRVPGNYSTKTPLPFRMPESCRTGFLRHSNCYLSENMNWAKKNYKLFPCIFVDGNCKWKEEDHSGCIWDDHEFCSKEQALELFMTTKQKELLVQILRGRPKDIQLHLLGMLGDNLKTLHFLINNNSVDKLELIYSAFLSTPSFFCALNLNPIKDEDVPSYPFDKEFGSLFAIKIRQLDNYESFIGYKRSNFIPLPVRHNIRYWGDDIELPTDHYREIYFKIPECCQVRFKKISSEFLSRNTEWVKKNYKVFPCLYIGQRGHMECGINTNEWCFHYQHLEDYITYKQKELLISILRGKTKNIQLHLLGKMACYLPKLRYMIDKTPKDQLDKVYQKFLTLPARYPHFNTTRDIDVPTYPFADTYMSFFAVRIKELENYQKLRFSPQESSKSEILETYEKVSSWFKERLSFLENYYDENISHNPLLRN